MRAHREYTEPETACGRAGKASGIARHVAHHDPRLGDGPAGDRRLAQPVVPAFGKPQGLAVGRQSQAMRIMHPVQENLRAIERRPARDQATEVVLFHKVAQPVLRLVPGTAIGQEDGPVGRGDDVGQALQRLVAGLIEPRLLTIRCDRQPARARRRRPATGHRDGRQDRRPPVEPWRTPSARQTRSRQGAGSGFRPRGRARRPVLP